MLDRTLNSYISWLQNCRSKQATWNCQFFVWTWLYSLLSIDPTIKKRHNNIQDPFTNVMSTWLRCPWHIITYKLSRLQATPPLQAEASEVGPGDSGLAPPRHNMNPQATGNSNKRVSHSGPRYWRRVHTDSEIPGSIDRVSTYYFTSALHSFLLIADCRAASITVPLAVTAAFTTTIHPYLRLPHNRCSLTVDLIFAIR